MGRVSALTDNAHAHAGVLSDTWRTSPRAQRAHGPSPASPAPRVTIRASHGRPSAPCPHAGLASVRGHSRAQAEGRARGPCRAGPSWGHRMLARARRRCIGPGRLRSSASRVQAARRCDALAATCAGTLPIALAASRLLAAEIDGVDAQDEVERAERHLGAVHDYGATFDVEAQAVAVVGDEAETELGE